MKWKWFTRRILDKLISLVHNKTTLSINKKFSDRFRVWILKLWCVLSGYVGSFTKKNLVHEMVRYIIAIVGLYKKMMVELATQHRGSIMTSSNGNIFCVTGPLCEEFTDQNSPGHRWIPYTKASDAERWINRQLYMRRLFDFFISSSLTCTG